MSTGIRKALKNTPVGWAYRGIRNLKKKAKSRKYESHDRDGYYCIGCGKYWTSFQPFPEEWLTLAKKNGWPYSVDDAETLNYRNYTCYGCGMTDRDRLYALYISQQLVEGVPVDIIEFAPTPPLSNFLKRHQNVKLRTSDLFMEDVDDKLDIQDLYKYKDESFDLFICSHILEHVDDDVKAMRELYRITRKGGWGITMVPVIKPIVTTHEDPAITDPSLRIKYFGQADHVRLYAKNDFISRLGSVGFSVELLDVSHFGKEAFEKNGISPDSVLYIAHK